MSTNPLLSVTDLRVTWNLGRTRLHAVDGVSFDIGAGETVGLVGESGCGKSSLGKSLLRLVPFTGKIVFNDVDIASLSDQRFRPFRKRLQMVFQDPFGSLNPRQTIGAILSAPLKVHGRGDKQERRERVLRMLERVGLPASVISRRPHEFSGGQRQRIGIARALILEPEIVICDEPVSALDLSIQAQVLNLLVEMKSRLNLSYLFISHDLSVVRYFADRILVMYLGRIVESGGSRDLWEDPLHPYTQVLLDAIPGVEGRPSQQSRVILTEDQPSAINLPSGCRFYSRCAKATDICKTVEPELHPYGGDHFAACHHIR